MSGSDDKDESGKNSEDPRTSGSLRRQITVVDGRIDSREIFLGTRDIVILHGRDMYHLRLTAQNKLILTK
jgi:hemin uptake protein HemP